MGSPRQRFILFATLAYAVVSLLWIFLSDQLLALFTDIESIVWLSTVKGIFFVVATSALFYFALHTVPAAKEMGHSSLLATLGASTYRRKHSFWLVMGLSIVITISMFVLHNSLLRGMNVRPMLILFIFPVILSAMLGGFWTGIISTLIVSIALNFFTVLGVTEHQPVEPYDKIRWLFFVINGISISILSELLQRSKSKDELQQRLLDSIVSGTTDAIFVKDMQWRYLMVNHAACQLMGKTQEQIIGRTDFELFPEESAQVIRAVDESVIRSGTIQTANEYLTTTTGQKLLFLATKGPIFDASGVLSGLFGISRDITERRRDDEDLRLVLQHAGDAIWITNDKGEISFANPAACQLTGHTLAQLQNTKFVDLLASTSQISAQGLDDSTPDQLTLDDLRLGEHTRNCWPIRRLDQSLVSVALCMEKLPDGRYIAFGRDMTEEQLAQEALRRREQQLARVLDGADQGYWDWNVKTNDFQVSARWETMLGYEPGELVVQLSNWSKYVHPADFPKALESAQRHLAGLIPLHQVEMRCLTKSGEWRWILTRGRVVERDQDGSPLMMSGTHTDISERKQFEQVQKDASTVFSSSYEGIMVVSKEGLITKVNPAFTRITGYSQQEVLGKSPKMLSSGQQGEEFYRSLWHDLQQNNFWRGELVNRRKSGDIFVELLSISTVLDEFGLPLHYIGVFSDISQFKAHEAELDRIAHYDTLTGLPNRRLLGDRLSQAILRAQRSDTLMALCFLDLDGFKAVNDQYGHAVGDQLLINVSQSLRQVLRANDTLARLGGDEFVILLCDMHSSVECTQILDRILVAASRPVSVDGLHLNLTVSIGVSVFPDDNSDPDSLLRHADHAMYMAKNAGKNRYQLFDPESDRQAQVHRSYLESIGLGLEQDQFVLHYQPKVDLLDGRIIGAEALIRWQHPLRGLLAPAEFLAHIQGSHLDQQLGEWVIEQALKQAQQWHLQDLPLSLSVNISATHLLQRDFCERLALTLQRYPGMPARCFELEVLETAAIADIDHAVAILQRCRQLGVHFSLDDFGTGYSSLTYLRKLPIDTLKIDQSFVRDMLQDNDDLGIVEGVIRLAKAFNRDVIAEGVETLAHGAALLKLGCHLAQGYGIARPMPADEFVVWCEKWQREQAWLTTHV